MGYGAGAAAALPGEFDFRAGDTTTLAPWMGGEAAPPPNGTPPTGDQPPGTGPGGGSPSGITLAAKPATITYGSATTLTGAVTPPGAGVDLEAAPSPDTAYSSIASGVADAGGGFSFHVKPDRNTSYRVLSQGVTSEVRTVYVVLRGTARRHRLGRHRYRVTLALAGPADLPFAGRRVRFYGGKHRTRLASARLREVAKGRLRARATVRLRSRRSRISACLPHHAGDAWGRPVGQTCWRAVSGSSRPAGRPARPSP
jgi:hypothetical protein